MASLKDMRLKAFVKDKMRETLLACGRRLVAEHGVEALSARKLAANANTSVGVIYNLFGTMDDFIIAQNIQTLNELYQQFDSVVLGQNPFNNLNRYMDVLAAYIEANPNLWHLLYQRHLSMAATKSTIAEARVIKKIDVLIGSQAVKFAKGIGVKEKRLAVKVLEMSLFALSGYLLGNKLNPNSGLTKGSLCKLLMNTYIAGLNSLRKEK